MIIYLHDIVLAAAQQFPACTALKFKSESITYKELADLVIEAAFQLQQYGLQRQERVAVYLPKQFEAVTTLFASSISGTVFVPINPVLKPRQVQHILKDCNVRLLVTSKDRFKSLQESLPDCQDLHTVLLVDADDQTSFAHLQISAFHRNIGLATQVLAEVSQQTPQTDADMVAILYTSGSTGKPKGVVLSHRNMVVGAQSVASYLHNEQQDVLLALLPLSFDYGLSQLTTAFLRGASVVLLDFLLVQDVVKAVIVHQITGIAAVPPLWAQLAKAKWPTDSTNSVRYFTNSGGAMPAPLLAQLQQVFPQAQPYLMYGLTEAFRSTFLPPSMLSRKPGSIGKAIPNAEVLVVRPDGTLCAPHEPGELVHRGPLVSLGYWNAPEKTAERFKTDPILLPGVQHRPLAVWSGDTVKYDEEGFLYFIGRRDEMIKTSGHRVSPAEVEDVVYALDRQILDVAAFGVPHPDLEQAIIVLIACEQELQVDTSLWMQQLKRNLPSFMLPKTLLAVPQLPKNANGKIDRASLAKLYQNFFMGASM